jgi:HK97 family phage portal protein
MGNWLARILPWGQKQVAAEGQYRPGPYMLSQGWLSAKAGRDWNWWQTGYRLQPYGERRAMVEACVSAYSQTVPMCPGNHWRKLGNGGRERVVNSALTRILRQPNDYQSISDFLLNLTRRLYEHGEAFALVARNNRAEIAELHLMRFGRAQIAGDGSVFYSLSGNEIVDRRLDLTLSEPAPARDVLHVRLHTPRHPLRGESPILSATLDLAMSGAALNQQIAFYLNQARPSFTLQTDQTMTAEQIEATRQRWNDVSQGDNAGLTAVLTNGLKANSIETSAVDAQLAEMLKMTDQNIALAMRVPLQILGIGGPTYASTELLMQSWIASGLGFTLNHIEEAIGNLFGLYGQPDEYLEFDTRALLRSAYRERIEALARGVISGIYSPDEARAEEDLPAVEDGYGAMPRVQQQVVPLSYGADLKPPSAASPAPPPAAGGSADGGGSSADSGGGDGADQSKGVVAAFRRRTRRPNDHVDIAA